jgi:hypothetical protein
LTLKKLSKDSSFKRSETASNLKDKGGKNFRGVGLRARFGQRKFKKNNLIQ